MGDRVLFRCLWLTIMSLITASAIGSLVLLYSGVFLAVASQFETAAMRGGSGILLAVFCYALCRHSDDLIDRPA